MSNYERFEMSNDTAKEAMETAVNIVKDIPARSGGNSRMGIIAGAATIFLAAVAGGVMLWRKNKTDKELRQPDEDAPVEMSDEDIFEITTAE